ncbi:MULTISPECIES: DUF58 domain-containing protein [Pontibacillus]|uniref:DUF58 domain-containing protein n=1 Tax=Pontibacillus chungwhensis TaxID=265426 RepID=A0ABY8UYH8_9BACI|nr:MULTISPECIES: DUF58 domain-containing protein [Pontibacillus]MCD5325994.1 DUF58 domain-containing protein [Pontibacillus sp. HN14]WIF98448.1 DUF58 domain-containing protein [Pontibacillus chungwhensis]
MKQTVNIVGKLVFTIVLLAILYAYAMFQGGFVSWFLFYGMLPFLIYMIGVLLYPISKWDVHRTFSKHMFQSGDSLSVDVYIERKFPFPLYYCVIEEYVPETLNRVGTKSEGYQYMNNPDALRKAKRIKRVAFPWFKRSIQFKYQIPHLPRGEHHFHSVRVKTGDFFGFVTKQAYYTVPGRVLVYPHKRDVSMTKRVNSFDEGAAPSYSQTKRDTTVVTGVREYAPGDRFSWIDWKTSAKKNAMMTKEFEQQKSSDVLLVLDATESPDEKRIAFEGSVELTASIIQSYKRREAQLAFLVLGSEHKFFPFTKSNVSFDGMNQYLSRVEPDGKTTFAESLLKQQQGLPNHLIVMIVTRNLTPSLKTSVIRLKQKHARVVFFYIEAKEQISGEQRQLLRELEVSGVVVNVLSEAEMTQAKFEVST